MDYFIVSIANEDNRWLFDGLKHLKTLRVEQKDIGVNFKTSKSVIGIKHFENHTYLALEKHQRHILELSKNYKNDNYLISANARVKNYIRGSKNQQFKFDGEVNLKLKFHILNGCKIKSNPKESKLIKYKDSIELIYKNTKKATVDVICKQ